MDASTAPPSARAYDLDPGEPRVDGRRLRRVLLQAQGQTVGECRKLAKQCGPRVIATIGPVTSVASPARPNAPEHTLALRHELGEEVWTMAGPGGWGSKLRQNQQGHVIIHVPWNMDVTFIIHVPSNFV